MKKRIITIFFAFILIVLFISLTSAQAQGKKWEGIVANSYVICQNDEQCNRVSGNKINLGLTGELINFNSYASGMDTFAVAYKNNKIYAVGAYLIPPNYYKTYFLTIILDADFPNQLIGKYTSEVPDGYNVIDMIGGPNGEMEFSATLKHRRTQRDKYAEFYIKDNGKVEIRQDLIGPNEYSQSWASGFKSWDGEKFFSNSPSPNTDIDRKIYISVAPSKRDTGLFDPSVSNIEYHHYIRNIVEAEKYVKRIIENNQKLITINGRGREVLSNKAAPEILKTSSATYNLWHYALPTESFLIGDSLSSTGITSLTDNNGIPLTGRDGGWPVGLNSVIIKPYLLKNSGGQFLIGRYERKTTPAGTTYGSTTAYLAEWDDLNDLSKGLKVVAPAGSIGTSQAYIKDIDKFVTVNAMKGSPTTTKFIEMHVLENPAPKVSIFLDGEDNPENQYLYVGNTKKERRFDPQEENPKINPFADIVCEVKLKKSDNHDKIAANLETINKDGENSDIIKRIVLNYDGVKSGKDPDFDYYSATILGWPLGWPIGQTNYGEIMEKILKNGFVRCRIPTMNLETKEKINTCVHVVGAGTKFNIVNTGKGFSLEWPAWSIKRANELYDGLKTTSPFREYISYFAMYSDLVSDSGASCSSKMGVSINVLNINSVNILNTRYTGPIFNGFARIGAGEIILLSFSSAGTFIHEMGHAFCTLWDEAKKVKRIIRITPQEIIPKQLDIKPKEEVYWKNEDSKSHPISGFFTYKDGLSPPQVYEFPEIPPGGLSRPYIFNVAGEFSYSINNVRGIIRVYDLRGQLEPITNCVLDQDLFGDYGDKNIMGCTIQGSTEHFIPSSKSIMNFYPNSIRKFNVISCGYCLRKITGEWDMAENYKVCMGRDMNTIKPGEIK